MHGRQIPIPSNPGGRYPPLIPPTAPAQPAVRPTQGLNPLGEITKALLIPLAYMTKRPVAETATPRDGSTPPKDAQGTPTDPRTHQDPKAPPRISKCSKRIQNLLFFNGFICAHWALKSHPTTPRTPQAPPGIPKSSL